MSCPPCHPTLLVVVVLSLSASCPHCHCCCPVIVIVLLLLSYCCCCPVLVILLLLLSHCCCPIVVVPLLLSHCCCPIVVVVPSSSSSSRPVVVVPSSSSSLSSCHHSLIPSFPLPHRLVLVLFVVTCSTHDPSCEQWLAAMGVGAGSFRRRRRPPLPGFLVLVPLSCSSSSLSSPHPVVVPSSLPSSLCPPSWSPISAL